MNITSLLHKAEKLGDYYLIKKSPLKLAESLKQFVVMFLPWFLVLFLLMIIPLLFLGLTLGASMWFVGNSASSTHTAFYYVSLVLLSFEAGLIARGTPAVFKQRQRGWQWLFYALLLHLLYGLLRWVIAPAAILGLVWSWALVVLCLWVLFQVKDHYQA